MAESVCPDFGRLAGGFERCQRLVTTDGDAAVGKAERALESSRPRWASMHMCCDVRRVSQIGKKSADVMQSQVTGMIQLALSLGTAGAMSSFRRMLRHVVGERLRVRAGVAGPTADSRRQALLDLFFPEVPGRGSSFMHRRIIAAFANGDWSSADCAEHYSVGCCAGEEDTRQKMTTLLCNTLARSCCPVFPRARWTRADATINWLGLLWSIHELLPAVIVRWACNLGTSRRTVCDQAGDHTFQLRAITGDALPTEEGPSDEAAAAGASGGVSDAGVGQMR